MTLLESQAALVTGGGQGIGRGIALELATSGASVIITHLPTPEHGDNARSACSEIQRKNRRAFAIPMDVTDAASVKAGVAEALSYVGRIDILVNNAGVMQTSTGIETTADDFDRCYEVNLKGMWITTQALLPYFKGQGAGKIVNICSTAGREGQPETPAYCASKAGVISLTQSLATTLGPYGINVNAVCPGLVWTPMSEQYAGLLSRTEKNTSTDMDAFLESLKGVLPLRRHVTAEDIGNAVVFLASSRARNITGQALNVDAGYMMN